MMFKRTCRQITRLLAEGQDRDLSPLEQLSVRVHFWICETCPRFARQLQLMREACARWRAYSEGGDGDEAGGADTTSGPDPRRR